MILIGLLCVCVLGVYRKRNSGRGKYSRRNKWKKCENYKSRNERRPNASKYTIHIWTAHSLTRAHIFNCLSSERREAKARQDRKERENLKILNEQKALQEKLKAKQLAAEADAARQPKMNPYNFDMIESEDSTDDEGKESRKRPPPPTWSLAHKRLDYIRVQAEIPSKIIDGFFSVAPRQVDLREIFPAIDDKHLRRNSSAVWNTPPRYSLMPKYWNSISTTTSVATAAAVATTREPFVQQQQQQPYKYRLWYISSVYVSAQNIYYSIFHPLHHDHLTDFSDYNSSEEHFVFSFFIRY